MKSKCRRLVPGSDKEKKAKAAFDELIRFGIVERVNPEDPNTWSSPLHFVDKGDNTFRVVGDYRSLNSKTVPDHYPLPHVRDYASKIAGSVIFSKVDLRKAFHLIAIDKRDRFKTCVTTPWGLFNFRRMSMGMANSAQSFQRLVDSVLGDIPGTFTYLDDVLVYW